MVVVFGLVLHRNVGNNKQTAQCPFTGQYIYSSSFVTSGKSLSLKVGMVLNSVNIWGIRGKSSTFGKLEGQAQHLGN